MRDLRLPEDVYKRQGIFLCGILAAIMSTADSQLLVTASAASEDLYQQFIKKDADSKEILAVARFTVIVVSVLAFVIAWNPNIPTFSFFTPIRRQI